jgi:ubiquinone/menaquinone biosynthesis C-methylase UbiE
MEERVLNAGKAFSKQAPVFDKLNDENKLSVYLRTLYYKEVLSHLKPNSSILELNGGTGIDAIFFAEQGHRILVTDVSEGMIGQLNLKLKTKSLNDNVRTLCCSYHNIHTIKDEKFDHIVSNFGGLNCTDDLEDVLKKLPSLLNSHGKITLVVMPKVSPWEILMAFKGNFSTAFRRFRKATPANIEGINFLCYYYNPGYITGRMKKEFRVLSLKGIYITVPPEFYRNFIERYPKLFNVLSKIDSVICGFFPFNRLCDHYMITLQKKK